jgi:hypothetical protein
MSSGILFQERQTLASQKFWTTRRFVLALFCFAAYFFSEDRNRKDADLFLVVGNGSVIIDGLWSTKRVKIDLNSIISTEIVRYSPYLINNPVYNLHNKGTIRFYTRGKYAVKLVDKDGLEYVIGSQDPIELNRVIADVLASRK